MSARVSGKTMNIRVASERSLERSYLDEFDPKAYLNLYYASSHGNPIEKGTMDFQGTQLYKFYTKYSFKWNNETARLLEFGGGPVILSLIGAVQYVSEIVFAAYLESERKEVELWRYGKEGAHDWSSHFKYVVNEVEHIAGDDVWRERAELLRKRISSIIACDILCDNPLLIKQEPFEIVYSSLCLEAACTTFTEYKEGVRKLVGLLKPGGFLLMFIVERQTYYVVGEKRLFTLYLTLEQIKEALVEAGTVVLVAERDPAPIVETQNPVSDYKGLLFVAAQKVE